jgi:hypothetical protein
MSGATDTEPAEAEDDPALELRDDPDAGSEQHDAQGYESKEDVEHHHSASDSNRRY